MSRRDDREAGPLFGLTVLELGEWIAAPYCTKLLGDLGAEVWKIERPDGDPSRRLGPFPGDDVDPERSAAFLYLNTSKRSRRLDLGREADRLVFADLASRVDVLVEDRPPGELEALGLSYERLAQRNPGLVLTSVTPFGQTGPNRSHESYHLNLYHSGGHASPFARIDESERAPARAGGYLGEYDAGLTAALGTVAAVLARARTGRGQHVDCSKQEAMMCLERVTIGRFANEPDPFSGRSGPGGLSPAKDGWVMLTTLETHQWDGLVRAMGSPAWSEEPWWASPAAGKQHADEIQARKDEWAATRSRDEIYHAAQAEGTPAGPVRDVAEVMAWEQARVRGFFRAMDHPRAGRLTLPTAPYVFSRSAWVGTRAPLLGEHDDDPGPPLREAAPAGSGEGRMPAPLEGVRIVDFTWAWAGPQGSLLLAMLGADVIKIESRARLDHARVHSLTAGSVQGGIDESPVFNDLNLGKRSLTLNLRTEEGRGLVRDLVAHSDVVLQNMRPGVLDRMGLGYEQLRDVRPDLIMLSSSAVGAGGPEGTYAGYAPTFACLSGIASISGHPDEPPMALSGSVDLRVGTAAAFAVLAALVHRRRTGEGQSIDLSSTEVMSAMMGHAFAGTELTGRVPGRLGNRDDTMAPHGCFRCRGEGEWGTWVTIAVGSDEEWEAFRGVVGDPALDVPAFATARGRKREEGRLDACVERWTGTRTVDEIVDALQSAGVAAARLQSGASLFHDAHVRARGVFESVVHPRLGALHVVRPPWRMQGACVPGPSPLLGQHSEAVLGEILGLVPEEVRRLAEAEVVY